MTTTAYGTTVEQPLELAWASLLNRTVLLRAAIVAIVIGSVLTVINQFAWVVGGQPLQVLPFVLVFLIPFAVVVVSQVAGLRQAHIDSVRHTNTRPEGILVTAVSHGIPARAVAIGVVFGSLNAIVTVGEVLLRTGDLAAVPVAPVGQAYVLPLVFALLSQVISYRRSRYQVAKR